MWSLITTRFSSLYKFTLVSEFCTNKVVNLSYLYKVNKLKQNVSQTKGEQEVVVSYLKSYING